MFFCWFSFETLASSKDSCFFTRGAAGHAEASRGTATHEETSEANDAKTQGRIKILIHGTNCQEGSSIWAIKKGAPGCLEFMGDYDIILPSSMGIITNINCAIRNKL